MLQTVKWALEEGVAFGAYPNYPDRENSGHTELQLDPEVVYADVLYQIGTLAALMRAQGGRLAHAKAHGVLYNQAAKDLALADAIVRAVRDFDSDLVLFVLAGSAMVKVVREAGLKVKEEVFADRGYNPDGSLVKHGTPGALHEDEDVALGEMLQIMREQLVRAVDGSYISIHADIVCPHGDAAHALAFARRIGRHRNLRLRNL